MPQGELEKQVAELTGEVRALLARLGERFGESGPCATHKAEIEKLWASIRGVNNWVRGLAVSLALVALTALFATLVALARRG